MRWFLLVLVLLVSSVYVLLENQKRFIREGDVLLVSGEPLMAISMYERALLNYVPFSPYNKDALEKMEKLCPKLKEKEHRLFCYETLRSALYQTKGLYVPYGERLKDLKNPILLTKLELYIERNLPPKNKYQTIYEELRRFMDYSPYPSVTWSLVVVFSLLGWVFSLVWIIWKGLTMPINRSALMLGSLSYLTFFGLWILGLYMA
ncbi:MAG: hypothetical protein ACK4SM_02255 [Aquificaceae bacterium]